MRSVRLSISDQLYEKLNRIAKTTVSRVVVDILEDVDFDRIPGGGESLNSSNALSSLIQGTQGLPSGTEFTLSDLPAFANICEEEGRKVLAEPTIMRATLGRGFNALVRAGKVPGVRRAKAAAKNGPQPLKFRDNSAVYVVDRSGLDLPSTQAQVSPLELPAADSVVGEGASDYPHQ